ncbi:MAG TPA: electron transfer flavoprotein subunit alpha/FixB family protein [Desulfotomaculum sp.]|nr:electron transfer flavoprotein subunit alpha/FixB family protein [Desulfotomaculum sp.]
MKQTDIWVWVEGKGHKTATLTLEMLAAASLLAGQVGGRVTAVTTAGSVPPDAAMLGRYGADGVLALCHPALARFSEEDHACALAAAVVEREPSVVLVGASTAGKSIAPRLAAGPGLPLLTACTALEWKGRTLRAVRSLYGGNVLATEEFSALPGVALVLPRSYSPLKPVEKGPVPVEEVLLEAGSLPGRVQVVSEAREGAGETALEDADIIVSGGRGLGGPEHYRLVRELAQTLGAACGASRAIVDAGWVPYKHQVGQTGKKVKPKIYFACGISGAVQHLAGMRDADIIVAINQDPEAPIFQVATYGIVGDVHRVLPALTAAFQRRLAGTAGSEEHEGGKGHVWNSRCAV